MEEDFTAWWAGLKAKLLPVLNGSAPLSSLNYGMHLSPNDAVLEETKHEVCNPLIPFYSNRGKESCMYINREFGM